MSSPPEANSSDPKGEGPSVLRAYTGADIERRATRGGMVTALAQIARGIVSGGGTLLLLRMLTPKDFGLVGMIVSITAIVDLLKDFGLSSATIQRERVDQSQVSLLFWINVGLGGSLTLLTAILAPLIAFLYGNPELLTLTLALSVSSLLGAIPLQHEAILKRGLRFAPIAWINFGSAALGTVAALLLAMRGFGPWALVARTLVRLAARAVLTWFASAWRPSKPERANVRELIRFGSHLSGFQLLNYLERNVDNVLVGKFAGAEALGFYGKAYEIMRLPLDEVNRPVASVAVPALSRLLATPDRYRAAYLSITRLLLVFTVPLAALAILTAEWLIPAVLGAKWAGAVPVFQWLALGLLIKPLLNTVVWLFVSQDRTRDLFRWGVLGAALALSSFLIGLPWGATGVAAAFTICELAIRAPILIYWAGRTGPVSIRDLLAALVPAWTCAAAVAAAFLAVNGALSAQPTVLRVAVACGAAVVAGVLSVLLAPWSRHAVTDGTKMWRSLRGK